MPNLISEKHQNILENFIDYGCMKIIEKGSMSVYA